MSCIVIQITPTELAISPIEVERVSFSPNIDTKRIGGIVCEIGKASVSPILHITDRLKGLHPKMSCGVVCSVADIHYIRVTPTEIQWVTPYDEVIYEVESDTNWEIVTL